MDATLCGAASGGSSLAWFHVSTESGAVCPGLQRVMVISDTTRKDGPLTVHVEQAGDALMVRASGELSRSTAERFEAELRQGLGGDTSTVVLDLSGVGFIDSTGLRSVLRMANHSLRDGGRLRMRNASAPVQDAIEWGGLERLLPLVD
jgi:anti-sigma B factor antagonist